MKYLGALLLFVTLMLNTADQSPLETLQTYIKDGKFADFLQHHEQFAKLDCLTLMHCLAAHRSALVGEQRLLNNEVNAHVMEIREEIKKRFDAQVAQYKEEHAHQEYPIHNVDYDVVANTFVYEEVINRAPWWCFWQHDYNRECALKTFSDLRDLSIYMSANNIQKRTAELSKEAKEAYIAREQQETDHAIKIVQKTIDMHWKKVYVREYFDSGEYSENFNYERKKPEEEAERQCIIL